MGTADAEFYGVKHLDRMNMRVEGPCPTTLEGLLVRTNPDWKLEVHIDTDEANCCDLPHASRVSLTQGLNRPPAGRTSILRWTAFAFDRT